MKLDLLGRDRSWLALAASLLIAFGVWHWTMVLAAPADTARTIAAGKPIGNNSDLYPRWLGARELLLHGRDPYSAELTREIQRGFYGRSLDSRNPFDPSFPESFVYPLYVVFLLAPTVTLPFQTVQEIFRWLLLVGLACSVPLWMNAIGFRPSRLLVLSGMVLAVSSPPGMSEYFQQNLAALVVFALAAATAAAVRSWLALSGFLLAFATIKPELSGLTIFWVLLWATGRCAERKRIIWSFAGTIAALLIAAEMVSPHWLGRFLTALWEYPSYGTDPSVLQMFLPPFWAKLASGALVGVLFVLYWQWRKFAAGSEHFGWALAWAVTVTLAVIPKQAAYNQALLIPALLVLLAQREAIRQAGRVPRAFGKGIVVCLLWQWLGALILSVAALLIPLAQLRPVVHLPDYTSLAVSPLTLLAVIATTLSLADTRNQTAALPKEVG